MGEGTLMYHERNDIPIPPLSEYLDEEEIAELAQLRVEMYRYSVARDAGVYGTWTPLMTEYYGDEDSGQSQFWALLAGVSLSGSAFDDPIIAPFLNRYARTIFEYTDEQWRAARNYLIQNWDRLVDEEMTQTIRDHPEWYVLAQEQRVEFDRYRDLDMELLKAQYYAIPWGDRSDWQTENPEQWEALDSYIDRELVRAFQFPYYAYFYHNYQYTRYFGYVTPDLLNPESIPEMEEDFLQALEDLEAYLSGETNVWTVYMETFFGPSPTGSFATSPPPAPSP